MNEFIEKIIIGRTIQAAFQRGKVYAEDLSKKDRTELKKSIKEELKKIAKNYTNSVSESSHINKIQQLSQTISNTHREKLKGGQLRIGTAQKLLNVYIKFLWCLDEAKKPKHCPIDRIVLKEIKDTRKWTDLKTIKEYKDVITKIRSHKGKKSIAKWEWELWNNKA
ncbi:hypothetical protein ISS37_10930 [candidate division KSB1 bacterium]|nr:hypothetical protein [candidate division KSB1 bacterium]